MKARILVTEDDKVQREILTDILTASRFDVTACASGKEALEALSRTPHDLLLTDLRMPDMDGIALLSQARRMHPDLEAVIMTAYATVQTAVNAMKEGASDYLAKPFGKDELLLVVNKALEHRALRQENQQLRELVTTSASLGNIIGECSAMQRVFDIVRRAIPIKTTVLILGESGTGKELVARHIHFSGPRREKPFIVVNCAAIPDTLVESELFGHEKGAFTGADASRAGKFEAANGGTIFLDEIGDMRHESQAKLLRVLQDGVVERVGATQGRAVDVRVIAATNCDLRRLASEGTFREDLYYRLEVFPIALPPLRERLDDLPMLVDHFRKKLSSRIGKQAPAITPAVFDAFRRYRWPGNVRELENTLEQMFILCDGDKATQEHLPEKLRDCEPNAGLVALPASGLVMEDLEQDLIRQAMTRSGGRIKEAAELLGISYKTLQYRLKKHEIER